MYSLSRETCLPGVLLPCDCPSELNRHAGQAREHDAERLKVADPGQRGSSSTTIYAAARPADRVILADSNDDMPHGYIRLGGATVEDLPQHRRPLSIRGFHQACVNGRINAYADLRDAVAWLQGVAVVGGDTADESVGVDFGEHQYLTVLGFLQCMSNVVINDGGTGLFAKLQVGMLLHGDKYVFVTEASRLGFWSIGQVFSRYRNYEGVHSRGSEL